VSLGPPPKLGDLIIVSVQRTGFHLTLDQIRKWLNIFGTICGELKHIDSKDIPGVLDDSIDVLMRLRKHIPSPLPAFSKKLFIRYKGQAIQCSKCMELGHIRKQCTSNVTNWMAFVKKLVDSKEIPTSYFGNWFEYLKATETVLSEELPSSLL